MVNNVIDVKVNNWANRWVIIVSKQREFGSWEWFSFEDNYWGTMKKYNNLKYKTNKSHVITINTKSKRIISSCETKNVEKFKFC